MAEALRPTRRSWLTSSTGSCRCFWSGFVGASSRHGLAMPFLFSPGSPIREDIQAHQAYIRSFSLGLVRPHMHSQTREKETTYRKARIASHVPESERLWATFEPSSVAAGALLTTLRRLHHSLLTVSWPHTWPRSTTFVEPLKTLPLLNTLSPTAACLP